VSGNETNESKHTGFIRFEMDLNSDEGFHGKKQREQSKRRTWGTANERKNICTIDSHPGWALDWFFFCVLAGFVGRGPWIHGIYTYTALLADSTGSRN